jgi:hypothetical protein
MTLITLFVNYRFVTYSGKKVTIELNLDLVSVRSKIRL